MWAVEHSVETTATPERIWRLWADVPGWPDWNRDIDRIELIGPFASGSTILMTPIGQETVELRIASAIEPDYFVDEAQFDNVVIRTIHRVDGTPANGVRVTYRMEIAGVGADVLGPQLGPEISGDFPETLKQLIARAERQSAGDSVLSEASRSSFEVARDAEDASRD
jgi:Polyketide cyclase / dehydrase and lipid transport